MKMAELLQKLKAQGVVFVRHGAKHDVCKQPETNVETTRVYGKVHTENTFISACMRTPHGAAGLRRASGLS